MIRNNLASAFFLFFIIRQDLFVEGISDWWDDNPDETKAVFIIVPIVIFISCSVCCYCRCCRKRARRRAAVSSVAPAPANVPSNTITVSMQTSASHS